MRAAPVYHRLLGARRKGEPPAATPVVLAAARIAGLSMNGERLHEGHVATSTEIVVETGMDRATVAAALDWIGENLSHVHVENGKRGARLVRVEPQEMAERWQDKWQRVAYPRRLRDGSINLRPTAALLVAWVCGQTGINGFKTVYVFKSRIGNLLDLKPDAVKRAIAVAADADALRRWVHRDPKAPRPVPRLHLAAGDALRAEQGGHDAGATCGQAPPREQSSPAVGSGTCGLPHPKEQSERPAGFRTHPPADLRASAPTTCGLPHPRPGDIRTPDLLASAPQNHSLTPVSRQTTTTGGEVEPAAVPGGGGDEPRTDQQQSQQPATPAEPTPTRPTADARAALAELRDEDARRALLTDPRSQDVKVRQLLADIGFATERPGRQHATAAAIAERHGDDAARWLLDLLHGIAADPTTDVPAVLSTRIKNGLLAAAEQNTATTANTNGKPPRPVQHDAGEGIRAENDRRRREALEADRERWLQDIVVSRVFGDRAAPQVVAEELALPVDRVAAIVAQEQQRRAAQQQNSDPQQPKRGGRRFARGASDDADRAKQREALARTLAFYEARGKRAPSHVVDAFAAAGGAR